MIKKTVYQLEQHIQGDIFTPIQLYLGLRDKFNLALLLESSDYHRKENARSFICLESMAACYVKDNVLSIETENDLILRASVSGNTQPSDIVQQFVNSFEHGDELKSDFPFFGFSSFEVAHPNNDLPVPALSIPLFRYDLFRYVLEYNPFFHQLKITVYGFEPTELKAQMDVLMQQLQVLKPIDFEFNVLGAESTEMEDEQFLKIISEAKYHCQRGDVFQLVLSRSFSQAFTGDDFQVYRALRNVNPSPYLFYFSYPSFHLMGSSPEAQIQIDKGIASIFPIAGTYKRTGNDVADAENAALLLQDKKELAEHVMLVDLARNDLSRFCYPVKVVKDKDLQFYSHVIHLVSQVSGPLKDNENALALLFSSFPAGTLSGAPKYKAIHLILDLEASPRGFYGGMVGCITKNGRVNKAIMIRSILSQGNVLSYRAGAGVVQASVEESELQEVHHKLKAIRTALQKASSQQGVEISSPIKGSLIG